jgi:hypothetical protein
LIPWPLIDCECCLPCSNPFFACSTTTGVSGRAEAARQRLLLLASARGGGDSRGEAPSHSPLLLLPGPEGNLEQRQEQEEQRWGERCCRGSCSSQHCNAHSAQVLPLDDAIPAPVAIEGLQKQELRLSACACYPLRACSIGDWQCAP